MHEQILLFPLLGKSILHHILQSLSKIHISISKQFIKDKKMRFHISHHVKGMDLQPPTSLLLQRTLLPSNSRQLLSQVSQWSPQRLIISTTCLSIQLLKLNTMHQVHRRRTVIVGGHCRAQQKPVEALIHSFFTLGKVHAPEFKSWNPTLRSLETVQQWDRNKADEFLFFFFFSQHFVKWTLFQFVKLLCSIFIKKCSTL